MTFTKMAENHFHFSICSRQLRFEQSADKSFIIGMTQNWRHFKNCIYELPSANLKIKMILAILVKDHL